MDWCTFNGIVSIASAMALAQVVMSPRIEEGLIVKSGLIAMIFSLMSTGYHMLSKSEDAEAIVRAGAALATGIFFVIVGLFVNTRTHLAIKRLGGKNGAT